MPAFPDTILALASPPGFSPRAILRASGPASSELLAAIAAGPAPTSRAATTARLHLTDDGPALPVLIARFLAPHSYTGEDAFEVQFPGNPVLVDRLIQRLLSRSLSSPVRLAHPGEFSARAFLNGRLTIEQAEGVAATIAARSAEQLSAAQRLLSGRTGLLYRAWADELLTLLALIEAGIDFTDQEDVLPIDAATLDARLAALASQMRSVIGDAAPHEAGSALATVALVGEPNAGKSTLFNALLGRARAVASPLAGTTRDVLRETLELSRDVPGAGPVELLDLPGLDDASRGSSPSAAAAQLAALGAAREADVVIHCDPTGRFAQPIPAGPQARIIRLRTKADLPCPPGERPESLPICALDGWRLAPLRRAIADAAMGDSRSAADTIAIPRHRRAIFEALAAITACRAHDTRRPRLPHPELTAESLRGASEALGQLTGRLAPDDVLGRIFSTFCIGK